MKNKKLIYLLIIVLVVWNIILTAVLVKNINNNNNTIQVTETRVNGFSTDLTEVYKKVKSSIVTIETDSSTLSGFIYSKEIDKFYVITCYHGVSDKQSVKVTLASGKELESTIKGYDVYSDIAVIEINSDLQVNPIELGDSDLLKDGEFVLTVASPNNLDLDNSISLGMISNKLKTITNSITVDSNTYEYYMNIIQLDANVTKGYSGSPIFNMAGQVEGVVSMKEDNAVFALPINEIKIIAENIINEKEYFKISLGINELYVNNLETYEKNQLAIPLDVNDGCYVKAVMPNSVADIAGIKVGDIIKSVNDVNMIGNRDLLSIEYSNDRKFDFKVLRNNEELTLSGSISD